MKREFITKSSLQTEKTASDIGKNLRGGEVIEFISDLGGGKTTFVRGLCAGAGSKDLVNSPTFTISNQYEARDLIIYHYDFYRLNDEPGLVAEELAEAIQDKTGVILVEWGQTVQGVLPENRVVIHIDRLEHDADSRKLGIILDDDYEYLLKGIDK